MLDEPTPDLRLGIDLGGTKTEIIALDAFSGEELYRHRIPTERGDYAATLRAIAGLIEAAETRIGRSGSIGMGHPGTISAVTGLVKNANSTWLNDRPLQQDLEAALGRTVRLANDADCFAVSEATDGSAKGTRTVFGMILGTGAGGGVVVDGRPLKGPAMTGGEIGHLPMPDRHGVLSNKPVCYCGRVGCIESYLSGPGMAREFAARTGREMDAKSIVETAENGDVDAEAHLQWYEDSLAQVLGMIVTFVDPDVIVFGGGLSKLGRLYETVPKLLPKHTFGDEAPTPIRPPLHGDSSGVRGAAWLWPPPVST